MDLTDIFHVAPGVPSGVLEADPVFYSAGWVLVLALFVLAVSPYVYELTVGTVDPFAPIMWNAPLLAIAFGIPAAERYVAGDVAFTADHSVGSPEWVMVQVLCLACIGIVALIYGYYRDWGRRIGASLPRFDVRWSSERAWVAICIMLVCGLYGFAQLHSQLGAGPRSHLAKGDTQFAFILVNLLSTASILIVADVLISAVSYERGRFTIFDLRKLCLGVALVLVSVRVLWTLGGRARAFGVVIVAVFLVHYLLRSFSLLEGVAVLIGVKFVPAWAASIAAALITVSADELIETLGNPVIYNDSPTRPFNNVVVLLDGVPGRQGFTYGETFASAFFEVLPLHPFREANDVYNSAFYPSISGDFGVPITMLGELYLNFWIPGVVVGFLVLGALMRTAYEWLVVSSTTAAPLVVFGTIANNFLLMGNFSNTLPSFGLSLLSILVGIYIVSGPPTIAPDAPADRRT